MKIIMLVGESNTGKTTTVKTVFETVIKNGGHFCSDKPVGVWTTKGGVDFQCFVEYKEKLVRFFSMGDLVRDCQDIISQTEVGENKIDILIIPYNVNHATRLDEQIKEADNENVVVEKIEASDADNERAHNEIMTALEELVK